MRRLRKNQKEDILGLFSLRKNTPTPGPIELPMVSMRPDGVIQTTFAGVVTLAHLTHMQGTFLELCRKGRPTLWFVDAERVSDYKIEIKDDAIRLVRGFRELHGRTIILLTKSGSVRLFASTLNMALGLFDKAFIKTFEHRNEAEAYLKAELTKLT